MYVGYTKNIQQRLAAHREGLARTTRLRGPIKLLYVECYIHDTDARKREKFLKSGRGREVIRKQLHNTLAGIV